jgi:AcrR family transcriptional regulator
MVLDAASRQVAEGGLEALSMRGLGKALGVEAMSLYKHVGRRDELVDLLRADMLSSLSLPDPVGNARRDLETICQALYEHLNRTGTAPLLLPLSANMGEEQPPTSGVDTKAARRAAMKASHHFLPLLERLLAPLRGFIPEPLDRAYAVHALLTFVLGQVVFAARSSSVAGVPLEAMGDIHDYPELQLILTALERRSPEVEFELGLRALLDAIESRRGF